MGIGVDYNQMNSDYIYSKTRNLDRSQSSRYQGTRQQNVVQNDTYTSSKGNTCTDGKDDGKIGLASAVGNIAQGAGKGVLNAVKGAFTNSQGKFSILKTAATLGIGALCVTFPAVGLAACAIGGVTGGAKLATGVLNAVNAKTDSEAKDAWEAVGEGGVTVAASVAGAKASYNAVQATASAASSTGTSAVAQLGKEASILQKASALGKDMVSSTKFNASNIKGGIELEILRAKAAKIDPKSALSAEDTTLLNRLNATEAFATEGSKAQAAMIESVKNSAANKISGLRQGLSNLRNQPASSWDGIKTTVSNLGTTLKNLKTSASAGTLKPSIANLSQKAQTIINFLAKEDGTYAAAVQNYGHTSVLAALEELAGIQSANQNI